MNKELLLNGTEINDIDSLIANLDDRAALLSSFRDGTLAAFLTDCFYTDEAAAVAGIADTDDDALYETIVTALTGGAPAPAVVYGRSSLERKTRKTPDIRKWKAFLKEKSRAFRENNNTIYGKRSHVLIKKLNAEDDRCYLVHDDTLFQTGAYGFAVLDDGIAYIQMMGSRKRRFLSFKEIREHGGLVNKNDIPAFRWYADWYKEQEGEQVWIPVSTGFVNEFIDYVNMLAKEHKKYEFSMSADDE